MERAPNATRHHLTGVIALLALLVAQLGFASRPGWHQLQGRLLWVRLHRTGRVASLDSPKYSPQPMTTGNL